VNYTTDDLIKVREVLVGVASHKSKISYKELADRAGLNWNHRLTADRRDFGRLLGEVSKAEYAKGHPLITSVVVREDTGEPGKGFLGLEGFPTTREFWLIELKRVHDYWAWS
jgi:hypothetical protein